MNCQTCSWMIFMNTHTQSDITLVTAYPMDHDKCPCI